MLFKENKSFVGKNPSMCMSPAPQQKKEKKVWGRGGSISTAKATAFFGEGAGGPLGGVVIGGARLLFAPTVKKKKLVGMSLRNHCSWKGTYYRSIQTQGGAKNKKRGEDVTRRKRGGGTTKNRELG